MRNECAQFVHNGGLTAKEMCDPRYIEKQPLGSIQRDQRRVAFAGIGNCFQQLQIRACVGMDNRQIGNACACIRQRHAGFQAETRRVEIDRSKPQRIRDLLRDHQGAVKRRAAGLLFAVQAICHQARKIERENSPFRFRGSFHCSPTP